MELFTVSADFLSRPVLVKVIIACDILSDITNNINEFSCIAENRITPTYTHVS